MPELPEVETIRRDLADSLLHQTVTRIEVLDRRLLSVAEEKRWMANVPGHTWRAITRKGKYLSVLMDNNLQIVFHLRMTGQLVLGDHPGFGCARLRLHFANGNALSFYDQRRFGEVWLRTIKESWPSAQPLGPDALEEMSRDAFMQLLKSKSIRIHALLLNQSCIAGIGNIYSQEALYQARIRPSRISRSLTQVQGERLYDALHEILVAAIEARGTSSRNYRDARGQEGSAQTLHKVYQQGGKPCPRCTRPLKVLRVGGRGTVYCPQCQK